MITAGNYSKWLADLERYEAALRIVQIIDNHLVLGTRHYRNGAGELLTTLDQVIRAILEDDLQ